MLDFTYDLVFSTSVAFIFIMLSSLLSRSYTKNDLINYIYNNRNNSDLRYEIMDMLSPQVGEIVEVISKPWNGMFGYITRMNDDYSYNIKITRTLNPFSSYFPKSIITKNNSDIVIAD